MDWKQILSVGFDELTDLRRDELYEHLVALRRQSLDKKHYKRLIDLLQHILQYKGDMVNSLLTELEAMSGRDVQNINSDALINENQQLKDIVAKLDGDKAKLKAHLTELLEENVHLQRTRSADAAAAATLAGAAEPSDADRDDEDGDESPDVLSELERHEQQLATISQKNKHIKRLLRDIDRLEQQAAERQRQAGALRDRLHDATAAMQLLDAQLTEHKSRAAAQAAQLGAQQLGVSQLEEQLTAMERERDAREREIAGFGARLEQRAQRWRAMLQEKDDRLDSLREKYEAVLERQPVGGDVDDRTTETSELHEMRAALDERDAVIADLQQKMQEMSRDMIDTTDVLNRLAASRDPSVAGDRQPFVTCTACAEAHSRLADVQQQLAAAEEDAALRAQQALDAMRALRLLQRGEDGLAQQLHLGAELRRQVRTRDAQIRAQVRELNGAQQLAAENLVLRQRLGLDEVEPVATGALAAKHRRMAKHAERLALKLRASEEMRLQLKLDRNALKRQLARRADDDGGGGEQQLLVDHGRGGADDATTTGVRMCEQCLGQYETDAVKCAACAHRRAVNWCPRCCEQLRDPADEQQQEETTHNDDSANADELATLAERYAIVVEENENLRTGMHEILQQLRAYDADAEHIVIDTPTLERLLHALDARSVAGWYHPAMRMQNELIAVKERELALKERVRMGRQTNGGKNVADKPSTMETNAEENPTPEVEPTSKSAKFPTLVQMLFDAEAELAAARQVAEAAVAQQRDSAMAAERLASVELQFAELTETLASDPNADSSVEAQLNALAGRQAAELVAIRERLQRAELQRTYAEEDMRTQREQLLAKAQRQSELVFELRRELLEQRYNASAKAERRAATDNSDALQKELSHLRLKLSRFSAAALVQFAALDANPQLPIDFERVRRLGLIPNDGGAVDFVARSEVDALRTQVDGLCERNVRLQQTNGHLSAVLQLSQQQLAAQQLQLNERAEDEQALRHLIVDLQSDSQERFVIGKQGRELRMGQQREAEAQAEVERLRTAVRGWEERFEAESERWQEIETVLRTQLGNSELKLQFLCKSHADMQENFSQFTPLYPLVDFVQHYGAVLEHQQQLDGSARAERDRANEEMVQRVCEAAVQKCMDAGGNGRIEDKIDVIKHQTQNAYLQQQLVLANQRIDQLLSELRAHKIEAADWSQQWDTIRMLFATPTPPTQPTAANEHKETQSLPQAPTTADQCVNTDEERPPRSGEAEAAAQPEAATADRDSASSSSDSSSSSHATFVVDPEPLPLVQPSAIESTPPQPAPRRKSISATTTTPGAEAEPAQSATTKHSSPVPAPHDTAQLNIADISLASQLKQAMALASTRSALLFDAEHQLTAAQQRCRHLERTLHERDAALRELRDAAAAAESAQSPRNRPVRTADESVLSATIGSLQALLGEKDAAMLRYQQLLRAERDQRAAVYAEHRSEVHAVQLQCDELSAQLRSRTRELEQATQTQLSAAPIATTTSQQLRSRRVSFDMTADEEPAVVGSDPHPHAISDALIEDMFHSDVTTTTTAAAADAAAAAEAERRHAQLDLECRQLHAKLREASKREFGWERTLSERDRQIEELSKRIERQAVDAEEAAHGGSAHRDLDHLREMLDEKDRHIGELTDTLQHFHDDQQKFIADTTAMHSSTGHMTELSADVARAEATNRILTTQLDATKRQLAAVAQRETQAREVIHTLKTQLIRRPVISVKATAADRSSSVAAREEQLQKRIALLEQEQLQTRDELRRQTAAAQQRRHKDADDLALWSKHKRSQQLAEQWRKRLGEREAELERVRGHLASAKAAVARLEREKQILETRRGGKPSYCQSPSCPNVHVTSGAAATASKYPSSSPDSASAFAAAMHEYEQQQQTHQTPPQQPLTPHSATSATTATDSQPGSSSRCRRQTGVQLLDISDGNHEVIDALRARIEAQQRRIVAMELEGRGGGGGATVELERLQERLSNAEALNIRLEARNLNLQLECDRLRQGDQGEKTRRQIKHLEDYIIALKSELTQSQIDNKSATASGTGSPSQQQQRHMEQSILTMRRIIERQKFEIKQLHDGKSPPPNRTAGAGQQATIARDLYEKMRLDLEAVQKSYAEALDRVSALQIEVDIQRSSTTSTAAAADAADATGSHFSGGDEDDDDPLALRAKLLKRSQLLEKAKILLGRAAAREKQFREQVVFWKRRCAELQNVPIIVEEVSE